MEQLPYSILVPDEFAHGAVDYSPAKIIFIWN